MTDRCGRRRRARFYVVSQPPEGAPPTHAASRFVAAPATGLCLATSAPRSVRPGACRQFARVRFQLRMRLRSIDSIDCSGDRLASVRHGHRAPTATDRTSAQSASVRLSMAHPAAMGREAVVAVDNSRHSIRLITKDGCGGRRRSARRGHDLTLEFEPHSGPSGGAIDSLREAGCHSNDSAKALTSRTPVRLNELSPSGGRLTQGSTFGARNGVGPCEAQVAGVQGVRIVVRSSNSPAWWASQSGVSLCGSNQHAVRISRGATTRRTA